jgi:DNA-binding XRE family transcriptional regulator
MDTPPLPPGLGILIDAERAVAARRAAFRVVTSSPRDTRNPVDVQVGERLRARRMAVGMPKPALARALGVDERTLDLIEDGRHRVSAGQLYLASGRLGVSVVYWFAPEGPA